MSGASKKGTAIVERGSGPALVLIPGIQGRSEYVGPAIDALAERFRVLALHLTGEGPAEMPIDPSHGVDDDVRHVVEALDARSIERAVVCGISFGGLVAIRFAAQHPDRTAALILASTPGPAWRLRRRHEVYARLPWIFGPLFALEAPLRMRRELAAAIPDRRERWRFIGRQLLTIPRAPLSLTRLALRARLIPALTTAEDCRRITAPTLVVTGDAALDHVVPADGTCQYTHAIAGARHVVLERTGHLGTITHPHEFARVVWEFTTRGDVARAHTDDSAANAPHEEGARPWSSAARQHHAS